MYDIEKLVDDDQIVIHLQAWPEAEFHIVPDAGHAHTEPGTQTLIVTALDKYKNL